MDFPATLKKFISGENLFLKNYVMSIILCLKNFPMHAISVAQRLKIDLLNIRIQKFAAELVRHLYRF